nr:NADH-quinone oxidoreductase subunit NuoB [Ferrovum sp.]
MMANILNEILRHGVRSESFSWPQADLETWQQALWQRFGRALVIRHVDAGSCNGCELEIHALNAPQYNLTGLGLRFSASPRHADLLLVTGPVSRHMEEALRRTYAALPEPRWVVAVGDCGHDGGVFGKSYACLGGVSQVVPVDVVVVGCPPTPLQLLEGIWRAVTSARGSILPRPE